MVDLVEDHKVRWVASVVDRKTLAHRTTGVNLLIGNHNKVGSHHKEMAGNTVDSIKADLVDNQPHLVDLWVDQRVDLWVDHKVETLAVHNKVALIKAMVDSQQLLLLAHPKHHKWAHLLLMHHQRQHLHQTLLLLMHHQRHHKTSSR